MLIVLPFLSGCATDSYKQAPEIVTPQWPYAGAAVADELEKVCIPENKCPALWDWLGRLDKLKEQLTSQAQNNIVE